VLLGVELLWDHPTSPRIVNRAVGSNKVFDAATKIWRFGPQPVAVLLYEAFGETSGQAD
jgi:hypothetical protein